MKQIEYADYQCSNCGRLATLPWRAAWCLHHDNNFRPHPPRTTETPRTRMSKVTSVVAESLPDLPWYVVEYDTRNRRNYSENIRFVIAGPMSETEALEDISNRKPDGRPYEHYFESFPEDLVQEAWRCV